MRASELLITESAERSIIAAARAAHPFETGGILVGVRSRSRPWVALAPVINTRESALNRYQIPAGVTRHLVRSIRSGDSRLGYLGDWHVHPADAGPSALDRSTMRGSRSA